jgi:exopolysaccharide production protein ExoQ
MPMPSLPPPLAMPPAMPIESAAATSLHQRIGEGVFLVFLLLAFIGVTPFKTPDPLAEQLGSTLQTGAGDTLRQAAWLVIFVATAFAAWRRQSARVFSYFPWLLLGLLAWCAASALWSPEPAVTIRRAGLALVLVLSAVLGVESVGSRRALALLRWVLLAVLIVNLVSVKFVAAAVHPPSELDPALIGNWRGLYGHKNIAGSVGAITALVFLFSPSEKLRWKFLDVAVAGLAVFFTVMTRSKSSLGLLVVALVAGGVYRLAWRNEIDRLIALTAAGLALTAATAFFIADSGAITRLFSDPQQFTGRTEIWRAELAYIRDHPLFGAGFGTFADTGTVSPLYRYVGGWVTGASHGHNGYLQLLVTVGGLGFALAFAALIVVPMVEFWRRGEVALKALLFSLFVFLALHNLMETDFLQGDGVAWMAYLLMLAMAANLRRTPT